MWSPFAIAVAGAAAGLTGLTFIVVAFRFDTIAVSTEYRGRAAQVLTLFLTVTVTGALIVIPQVTAALGVELLIAGLVSAVVLHRLDTAARHGSGEPSHPSLTLALCTFVGLIVLAGVLLTFSWAPDLYFYAPAALLGLTWGVYGAWTFLTRAGLDVAGSSKRPPLSRASEHPRRHRPSAFVRQR